MRYSHKWQCFSVFSYRFSVSIKKECMMISNLLQWLPTYATTTITACACCHYPHSSPLCTHVATLYWLKILKGYHVAKLAIFWCTELLLNIGLKYLNNNILALSLNLILISYSVHTLTWVINITSRGISFIQMQNIDR